LSWLSGWQYRKSHEIQGSTAGAQTDYQVRIVVHYGSGADSGEDVYLNGKCRTDFGDIRFTDSDGVTELSYWMEEKVDGDYAIFWVKIPSIPASPDTATIYIYYGKSDATTTSNGENTFLVFEDFETGASPSDTGWSVDSEVGAVIEGYSTTIHKTGSRSFYQTTSSSNRNKRWGRAIPITDNYAFMGWGRRSGSVTTYASDPHYGYNVVGSYSVIGGGAAQKMYCGHNNVLYGMGEGGDEVSLGVTVPDAEWHKYEIRKVGSTIYFYYDDVLKGSKTITTTPNRLFFGVTGVNSATTFYYDGLALRKYVDPEPSHGAWGSEETAAVTLSVSVLNESLDKSRGIAGEIVTYTAIVQDENGDALPSTFKVTLKIDGTILIQDQPLTSDVYDPATKKLTLQWMVPSMSTLHTVKITWSEQTIDTTTYLAGESTGIEFEIILIPPTLTSEQIESVSLTLIVCLVFISFETVKEMAENTV